MKGKTILALCFLMFSFFAMHVLGVWGKSFGLIMNGKDFSDVLAGGMQYDILIHIADNNNNTYIEFLTIIYTRPFMTYTPRCGQKT